MKEFFTNPVPTWYLFLWIFIGSMIGSYMQWHRDSEKFSIEQHQCP